MSSIKKYAFFVVAAVLEVLAFPFLAAMAAYVRFFHARKMKDKSLFIGMMHINNLVYVARAMRERGYDAVFVPWMIPAHEVDVIAYDINLQRRYPKLYNSFPGLYLLSYGVFVWSLFRFRVYLMPFKARIFDRSVLLKWVEIPLLHLAGKKVILNTFGGDVATPRLKRRPDLKYSLYNGYIVDPGYMAFDERAIAMNRRVLEKQADFIISAIDHVDYMDRVDAYFHLRCIDTATFQPSYANDNTVPVLIHAPNHRQLKGTDQIIAAVDSLNRRGIPCVLKIVENTSNTELMDMIAKADAVVDQLILGAYARLAIEAMALGKPVLCYMREDLYEFNPIWKDCPIINVNPDTIERQLENFLTMSAEDRHELGQRSRAYVEKYHSLDYVGGRLDSIIESLQSRKAG